MIISYRLQAPGLENHYVLLYFIHIQLQNPQCTEALWWWKQLGWLSCLNSGSYGGKGAVEACGRERDSAKTYAKVNGIAILSDGKTQATEEQIEAHECRIDDFAKAASLAKHIILSTMSACIGMKIKTLNTAKEMWDEVKKDTTTKSMLYLVDVECQLKSMRLSESSDPKTHLTKLKLHFQLMMLRHKNLLEMG